MGFEYWNALSVRQRVGLSGGVALIVAAAIGSGVWLLRDPQVRLVSGVGAERVNELAKSLNEAKVEFRIGDGGDVITVPRSQLGKAHAAASGGPFDAPPSVGLELFKETDFSSTDFAQRINYQRALQGELTRTIQTIAAVRSARVHVILPDSGVFKRNAAKATAAVSIAIQPGNVLTRSQVRGIQRLVAASVPEIKVDDVVVLDESGASLTRAAEGEGDFSSAYFEHKREADQYFENRLSRLLQEMVSQGTASLAVDTTLDEKQLRVTTDEPVPARATRASGQVAGVLIKERQSQRGRAPGIMQMDSDAGEAGSTDWEYEYKVGSRIEQTLSTPGSIKRLTVAVALRGVPSEWTSAKIEDLVAHAVGMDRARGDSVAVMLLPDLKASSAIEATTADPMSALSISADSKEAGPTPSSATGSSSKLWIMVVAALLAVVGFIGLLALLRERGRTAERHAPAAADIDAITARVRQWLNEGPHDERG